jgi:hypothetical protein|tara:strand:- start:5004 stop:6017 length:1014 start_codon:yes stop_codon:yes gene_type:complete
MLNSVIVSPDFFKTIDELKKKNISITNPPSQVDLDFSFATFPPNGKLSLAEELGSKNLDLENGEQVLRSNKFLLAGYDESTWDYPFLEGSAFFTSHALVIVAEDQYVPIMYLSNYFLTRSKLMSDGSQILKYADDLNSEAKKFYAVDRSDFLEQYSPKGSLLFVDGPLIGAQMTSYTVKLIENLHEKGIIPIFFVKNSISNLVTDNIPELRKKYNSDLHWSSKSLKRFQRTNLFKYTDEHNARNAKLFCYYKVFDDVSTQRIELHLDTYSIIKNRMNEIFDLVTYLQIVNGDKSNPQIRPISIAEKYARAALQQSYCERLVKGAGLVPTMNQERGFE